MNRFTWSLLAIFLLASPAWADKKITVGQLEDLLRSMQRDKKADVDVATALKQVELSEELTRARMNSIIPLVPGPFSTEQIYILEARSADLIPPPSDLPATPAPDPAAEKAILSRTVDYVAHVYDQLPTLAATRTTLRFQDNYNAVGQSSGIVGSATEVDTVSPGSLASHHDSYVRYINSTESAVIFEHGSQKFQPADANIRWGANKMIALQTADPSLGTVFKEAQASASIQWLRWELINGKPAAVFSFSVPRKNSRLDVKVCCFPKIDQQGVAHFYTPSTASAFGGDASSGGGVAGDWQTTTDWHDFRTAVPYHGEFFVDPDTGSVLRLITQAEFKPSDLVHQVDTRVDYGTVRAGARTVFVPVKSFINTLVVPGGDSGAQMYSTRTTLFTSEFTTYRTAAQ
ncbi:MAG TPA: hypothetical protein VG267_00780 [Terracidiphilus sp.]|jgi:hypothetical protein|nr:hypothetical protein [Terracidiphilus sp.]